jgi:flagellar protein FlaG
MVGNVTSVTAAPARTSAPPVPRNDSGSGAAAGKEAAAGGKDLPQAAPPPPPVVDVDRAVERLNELMSNTQRMLRFRVDEGSGRTIITVINETTKEIVRQIPAEEVLAVSQTLEELGSLIDARA